MRVEYAIRQECMLGWDIKGAGKWISARSGPRYGVERENQETLIPGKRLHWYESGSLGSTFRFLVIILFVFPLVFITMIKEIGRGWERPPAGVRDVAKLKLCLIDHCGPWLDINPLWWQKLL